MIEIKRRQPSVEASFSTEISPLLQRIYANRGISNDVQLDRRAKNLLSYEQLNGVGEAVSLLLHALMTEQKIVIVGDFDVDGATSSALSVVALRAMGFKYIDYIVPNRFHDGYGLTPEVVAHAAQKQAQVIITVDNGVSAMEGVAAAKALGMTVIVTDHHLQGVSLPDADAIVNPNLKACSFPSKSLAGVGVAFYLMAALRSELRARDWFREQNIPEFNVADLLDLVAIGTVADLVALDGNNRILVHQGIMRIRAGKCRAGIQALIEISGRNMTTINTSDIGYALAPRLNAAGRLDDMSCGIELLLCEDISQARQMAKELDGLNQSRKEIEQGMKTEAIAICERLHFTESDSLLNSLVLYQKEWHQGVIGILASRIKEKFHRPTIVFAGAGDGLIKGSARSIKGLHMRDALEQIDTQHPHLIKMFGGHAMAAGLTIAEADLSEFSALFNDIVSQQVDDDILKQILLSDGELSPEEMNLAVAELLRSSGPWGQGFPEPLFDGTFKVLNQKLIGGKHLKMMLEPADGGNMLDAIAFNIDLRSWPDLSVRQVNLAYRLDVNEFRGKRNLQLLIEHLSAA